MVKKELSNISDSFEFINLMSQDNMSLSEVYYNLSHYYLGIDKVSEQKFYLLRSFQENYFLKWIISSEEGKLLETGNTAIDLLLLFSTDFTAMVLIFIFVALFCFQLLKKKFRVYDYIVLCILIICSISLKNIQKLGIIKKDTASFSGPSELFKKPRPSTSGEIVLLLNQQGNFQKVYNSKKEIFWVIKNQLIKI